jgi:hypothetical protein
MKVFPVDVQIDGDTVTYKLNKDITICGVLIPKGFVTDGASVPRMFWGFFPPVLDYFGASILHDYLLSISVDWKEAENAFKKALEADGVGAVRLWIMLNAVRLNGFIKGKR